MRHEDGNSQRKWEPMRLTPLGTVAKVVRGGGGKLSSTGGDPGEMQKQPPTQ